MKKIERAQVFISNHLDLFRCPICKDNFQKVENNLMHCNSAHSFNISKKGTVHFLTQAANNQYDKQLFEARMRMADLGLWQPIINYIAKTTFTDQEKVLDVGCGNGYNLNALKALKTNLTTVGMDISKFGIEMAAKHFSDSFWCVADLAHSPFSDQVFDSLLNLFTPSHYEEFDRLLKPGGQLIKVVPNANYLIELRQLDDQAKVYSNDRVVAHFKQAFPHHHHKHLTYSVKVPNEALSDLLEMTPLSWQADKESVLTDLKTQGDFKVTIDVSILTGKKGLHS